MTEIPDAIALLLYAAQNASPFTDETFYQTVTFVSGYPAEDVSKPAVAIYLLGGSNSPKGLGTVTQYRRTSLRVDVITEHRLENQRIVEKLRDVWQADFDVADPTDPGTLGNGYLRAGGIKYLEFAEAGEVAWDVLHVRQVFDVTLRIGD